LRKRKDQTELKPESPKDKKTESSTLRSLNNLVNKDFWLASAQDPVNLEEPMVIFWKENNSNSTLKKSNPEKNDLYHHILFLFHFLFIQSLYFGELSVSTAILILLRSFFFLLQANDLGVFLIRCFNNH